ncbi:MAG: hypothetical protein SFV23_26490 [Planctomycetaceae bacterium]|nr:hypothetical protein [Planctomycetaceae bacterium]
MFRQFIGPQESLLLAEYLGFEGLVWLGEYSFAALTDRRMATMRITRFGEVIYQDAFIDMINSSIIFQPSKFWLHFWVVVLLLLAIPTIGLTLLLIPLAGKMFYALKKSGLAISCREGFTVWAFTDRSRLQIATEIYRAMCEQREIRIKELGRP